MKEMVSRGNDKGFFASKANKFFYLCTHGTRVG
jgi:hypothetical protein